MSCVLSVVVVVYNIPREAPRTLFSLSTTYQQLIAATEYEVIVVDNGSNPPFDVSILSSLPGNFRLIRINNASPSPVFAINQGIAAAQGDIIGVMIDGARIITPRLLHFARHAAQLYETAIVSTLGWYIGSDLQRHSAEAGYDQSAEDALLAGIRWQDDGYRLYEISTLDESSDDGWFKSISESNALFLRRKAWEALNGMDERFDLPGGGLANLDLYARAMQLPGAEPVILLGEATFHQLHGGIATNATMVQIEQRYLQWDRQYESIRGHRYCWPKRNKRPTYLGSLPNGERTIFTRAALTSFGKHFDKNLWSTTVPAKPTDTDTAEALQLAHQELTRGHSAAAVSIARIVRMHAPRESEPLRLLRLLGAMDMSESHSSAEYFAAVGDAYALLKNRDAAAVNYKKAIALNRRLPRARLGMAKLKLRGERYYYWIEVFRAWLRRTFHKQRHAKVQTTSIS